MHDLAYHRPGDEVPPVSRTTAWDADRAALRIEELRHLPGAILPILHALQEEFGYVDQAAVPLIAEALNLSRAEVHGVVSFYHDFRKAPPGTHVLKLCRAEACQSMGADALAAEARQRLRIDWGETTVDGRVTLEPVFCLGLCACAPAAMLDGKVVGGLDRTRLGALLDQGARDHDDPAHLRVARCRRTGARRRRGRARDHRSPNGAAGSRSRSSAPARAGSFGSSR